MNEQAEHGIGPPDDTASELGEVEDKDQEGFQERHKSEDADDRPLDRALGHVGSGNLDTVSAVDVRPLRRDTLPTLGVVVDDSGIGIALQAEPAALPRIREEIFP